MTAPFTWGTVGAKIALLATELDALGDGWGTVYGPERGGANSAQLGTLHLHLASNSLVFTTISLVKVYLVPSVDLASGSAYPTYTAGASFKLTEPNYLAGVIYVNPATQASNVVDEVLPNIIMPPGFFKTILVSKLGVTMPASGNTLDFYPTPSQY